MSSPAPRPAHRSFADPFPAIVWGLNYISVPPYALIFFGFSFFLQFLDLLFCYFLLFFSPFQFLLIHLFLSFSSYLSYSSSSSYSSPLYFKLFVVLQTCMIHIRHSEGFFEGVKPFFYPFGVRPYVLTFFVLFFFIFLFIYLLILIVLYSSSSYYSLLLLNCFLYSGMHIKHTLGKVRYINGKIITIQRKPREMSQFCKKSAKVYHSLYSSTEQLQVAL